MENWWGFGRTNFVRVKDQKAFLHWARSLPNVSVIEKEGRFALCADGDDGWPAVMGKDGYKEFPLIADSSKYLEDGEVFVFKQVGLFDDQYITGWAQAVNSTGEVLSIQLDDIHVLIEGRWKISPDQIFL